jgi:dynein heavy chain
LDKLKRVEAEMQKLIEEFDEAKAKEQDLSEQYDEAEKKCRRAKTLIEKLSDEEVNWGVSLRKNKEDRENLVGDIIISSGVIAYLGAFSVDYRAVAVSNWVKLMKSFEIKSADKFSLKEVLGNGVKI